jgi:hypothetical protein
MRRGFIVIGISAALALLVWAQRDRAIGPAYDVRSLLRHETAPAQYQQVDVREMQALAADGWELVAVVPYIYKNEERGTPDMAPRPMVTQTYPAYYFKRLKPAR